MAGRATAPAAMALHDAQLRQFGKALGNTILHTLLQKLHLENDLPTALTTQQPPPPAAKLTLTLTSEAGNSRVECDLAPIVAGAMSSVDESAFTSQMLDFATQKAHQAVDRHSESIREHGHRMKCALVDTLANAVRTSAAGPLGSGGGGHANPNNVDGMPSAVDEHHQQPVLDEFVGSPRHTSELYLPELDRRSLRDSDTALAGCNESAMSVAVVNSVLRPLNDGFQGSLACASTAEHLVDTVILAMPLRRLKEVVKAELYQEYISVCRCKAPSMELYGQAAGSYVVDFVKKSRDCSTSLDAADIAERIAQDSANIDHDLIEPLLQPFMTGLLRSLAGASRGLDSRNSLGRFVLKTLFGCS